MTDGMSGDADTVREALTITRLARDDAIYLRNFYDESKWWPIGDRIDLLADALEACAAQRDALAEALEGLRAKRSLGTCWCTPHMLLGGGLKHTDACDAARAALAEAATREEAT